MVESDLKSGLCRRLEAPTSKPQSLSDITGLGDDEQQRRWASKNISRKTAPSSNGYSSLAESDRSENHWEFCSASILRVLWS